MNIINLSLMYVIKNKLWIESKEAGAISQYVDAMHL